MLLKLDNIGKIYDSDDIFTIGIRGVSLEFDCDEFVTVEGESGAGKSTLLSIIGANEPTEKAGCIWTGGRLLSRIGLEIYAKTTCSFHRFIMMVKLKALKFVSSKIMRVNG